MHRFSLRTTDRSQVLDITADVEAGARAVGVANGAILVHVPHTTAAVTINENADPHVPIDVLRRLEQLVPWRDHDDLHGEGNSAAHVKSSLIGCSQVLAVQDGKLRLGTWQGVWFCEFDGPRQRKVEVSAL
jgi:secondary thiamine-phosphate synthase enzyme